MEGEELGGKVLGPPSPPLRRGGRNGERCRLEGRAEEGGGRGGGAAGGSTVCPWVIKNHFFDGVQITFMVFILIV